MRYLRKAKVVLVQKMSDDSYLVTDGDREYFINKETFEREYSQL